MKSVSDSDIVLIQNSDESTLHRVFNQLYPMLFSVAFRYSNEISDAEDAVMMAWVNALSHVSKFQPKHENSFYYWLKKIVINESIKIIKTTSNFHLVPLEVAEGKVSQTDIEISIDAEHLRYCIQQLPAGYRTVFNLYAVEGYSHKEIAETLQITESTSKSQYLRARNQLQKLILKYQSKASSQPLNVQSKKL